MVACECWLHLSHDSRSSTWSNLSSFIGKGKQMKTFSLSTSVLRWLSSRSSIANFQPLLEAFYGANHLLLEVPASRVLCGTSRTWVIDSAFLLLTLYQLIFLCRSETPALCKVHAPFSSRNFPWWFFFSLLRRQTNFLFLVQTPFVDFRFVYPIATF